MMREVYKKYTVEDVKELVEAFYGDDIFFRVDIGRRGNRIYDGSDVHFDNMENFLLELDKRGYEIIPKERSGCLCGRSE